MTIGFAKYSRNGVVTYNAFMKTIPYGIGDQGLMFRTILDSGNDIADIQESRMPVVVAALRLQGFEISGWQV